MVREKNTSHHMEQKEIERGSRHNQHDDLSENIIKGQTSFSAM